MGVEVCVAAVDAPRPPAHAQGGPAWTGEKPNRGQSSPEPVLSVCLHPINAHPGAWDCGWALSSSIIFPSRNVEGM